MESENRKPNAKKPLAPIIPFRVTLFYANTKHDTPIVCITPLRSSQWDFDQACSALTCNTTSRPLYLPPHEECRNLEARVTIVDDQSYDLLQREDVTFLSLCFYSSKFGSRNKKHCIIAQPSQGFEDNPKFRAHEFRVQALLQVCRLGG